MKLSFYHKFMLVWGACALLMVVIAIIGTLAK